MLAERLKECRKAKGVTQKDIANFLGIITTSYQKYEHGSREPSIEMLGRLAGFFEVTVDFLTGRSNGAENISIDQRAREMLSDNRLSLGAKGLYMQLALYSSGGKIEIPNNENFLDEYKISKEAFDNIIDELVGYGYL